MKSKSDRIKDQLLKNEMGNEKMGNRKDNYLVVLKNGPKEESSEWVVFKQSLSSTIDLVLEKSRNDKKDNEKHIVKGIYRFETNGRLSELELSLKNGVITLVEVNHVGENTSL